MPLLIHSPSLLFVLSDFFWTCWLIAIFDDRLGLGLVRQHSPSPSRSVESFDHLQLVCWPSRFCLTESSGNLSCIHCVSQQGYSSAVNPFYRVYIHCKFVTGDRWDESCRRIYPLLFGMCWSLKKYKSRRSQYLDPASKPTKFCR